MYNEEIISIQYIFGRGFTSSCFKCLGL